MMASLIVLTTAGLVIGAMQIEKRGIAFFLFRNTGAGAGNARNLNEVQGPNFSAVARANMNDYVMLFALLCLPVCAFLTGRWVAHKLPEPVRKAVPVKVPVPMPVWEMGNFYSRSLPSVCGQRGPEDSYNTQRIPVYAEPAIPQEVAAVR